MSLLEPQGFKKAHLLQLKNVNIPEVVQESINHFAFALQHNEKVKTYQTPLNVFMSVLKKEGRAGLNQTIFHHASAPSVSF